MRCAVCGRDNKPERTHCLECGMELDAPLHEEISKLDFLLEELKKWERHGRISSRLRSRLEGEYRRRRRDIVGTLTSRLLQVIEEDKGPREGPGPGESTLDYLTRLRREELAREAKPEVQPEAEVVAPGPLLQRRLKKARELKPAYAPLVKKEVAPEEEQEPAVPAEPRDFKYYARHLFSDRNIRILQQVGIFVFIAGVITFVTSQWTTWPRVWKMLSMVLLTAGFFVGGSVLRKKTLMRWTAISVTMIGSLFIPITCFMAIQHGIFTGEPGFYWVAACLVSVGINGFLARVLSEEVFAYFAWAALYGLVASFAEAFDAPYEGFVPWLAGTSAILLLLRPLVVSAEAKMENLDISFSRPLEILSNVSAAILFVLLFVFLGIDSYSIREHFVRHFATIVFLTLFCIQAAKERNWSFYLYFACVLKITAFALWVAAFEPDEVLVIPLFMALGVSFYVARFVFETKKKPGFALPYIIFGSAIRGLALFLALAAFGMRGDIDKLNILLLTLGQFAGLCAGAALLKRSRKESAWMLAGITAWLFVLLSYLEVGWHNYPVYYLALAAGACATGFLIRRTRFGPLSSSFTIFTHVIGIVATISVVDFYFLYLQEETGHGIVSMAAAAVFAFYVGTVTRRLEWLTAMFAALSGLLVLVLHGAGVEYYYYPACLAALASAAVLLTIGGISWSSKEASSLVPFVRLRPDWPQLRRLLSLPGLAGSLLVASFALALLLVSYGVYFDKYLAACGVWRECLLGVAALGAYCIVGALSAKREEYEYATLILAALGCLLFMQSYSVTLAGFAVVSATFTVCVIFAGLLFSFLKKKFMTRSALMFGVILSLIVPVVMLMNPQSYDRENLLSPALVLTIASAVFCYFSLRRQRILETSPEYFTYVWAAFAVGAYSFFFMWSDTQLLRDLYTVPAAGALLACYVLLRKRGFDRQCVPLAHVSYAAAVAPFIFMLAQAGSLGHISADTHLTLIVALTAVCAYHVAAASVLKQEWLEYVAISTGYLAFATLLLRSHVGMTSFGLYALPAVFGVFLVGMTSNRLRKRLFARSPFLCGLVLLGVSVVIPLCHPASYEIENFPFIFATLLLGAGVAFYFALRKFALFEKEVAPFTYAFGILLCAGYSFFFLWSGVQLVRDLYTIPPAAGLLALSVYLKRKGFGRQRGPAAHVSYGASLAPFLFILVQAAVYGQFSPDTHITLMTVLFAVCTYHIAAAVLWKEEWPEYPAIAAGYLGFVTILLKNGVSMPKFGFLALPPVFVVFLAGMVSGKYHKRLFARSAFLCGLVLLAVSVVIPMCHPGFYEEENLPFVFSTLLLAAGVACYFSLRRFALFERAAVPFSYSFAVLLCIGHALLLQWLSTGTPLAGLYFLQVSVLLVVVGWLLKRFGFERQWRAPCFVGLAATGAAMYLAISRSDLTAMLVFIACSVLYGFLQRIMRYRFFIWAASLSFSTAYFFALRQLDIEPVQYLVWFCALAAAKVAFSIALARAKEIAATPVFVIGLFISFSAMVVMLALSKSYFTEHVDMAIVSTLIAAGTYLLSARRTGYILFYYLGSLTALGAYYLVLHKYHITMAEFFTLPVAGLIFAATAIYLHQGLRNRVANWAFLLACGMLLLPSIVRSTWISHLDSCIAAYALSFGCLVGAMMFRRKVLFGAGLIAIIFETVVKMIHFIVQRHLSKAEVIMIVGLAIFIFAASLELIRNRRLREKAGLTRHRLRELFSDWS